MSKLLALIIMSFILMSCGDKKATSAVKLRIIAGNTVVNSPMAGGVLIMGKSESKEHSFRMGFQNVSDIVSLSLPRGRWEFAAVSWAGDSGPMTGDNRCAYTGMVDLKDAETSVNFTLTMERCLTDFGGRQFSHHDHIKSNGRFLDFFPVMCMNNAVGTEGCQYNINSSSFFSYKVVYEGSKEGQVTGEVAALSSACLPMNQPPRVKIPVTESNGDSPFKMKTYFYKSDDCTAKAEVYNFDDGIIGNNLPVWNSVIALSSYYSYIYLNPGPAYDLTAVQPTGLIADSELFDSGKAYFKSSTEISYLIPSIPPRVKEMCVTTSACSPSDWVAPSTWGTLAPTGLPDGVHTLKLFYRTENGVVSTIPSEIDFGLDSTPPVPLANPNVTVDLTLGVTASWNSSDNSLFDRWYVEVCPSNTCTTSLGSITIPNFSQQTYGFAPVNLASGIISGNLYCVRVKAIDKFNRAVTSLANCVTAPPP